MKIQFDANQDYQLEAVKAVTDLFRGQPVGAGDFRLERTFPQDQYLYGAEFVVGNHFAIDETTILENLQAVQQTNGIAVSSQLDGLHFSLEMETGTGKTYVYLRTIHELYKKYGFRKFIVVVPGLAIKEGVLKNLQITREHFDMLYEKKLSRLSLKMGHRSGSFVNPMLRPVDCQRVPLILSAATASDDSA